MEISIIGLIAVCIIISAIIVIIAGFIRRNKNNGYVKIRWTLMLPIVFLLLIVFANLTPHVTVVSNPTGKLTRQNTRFFPFVKKPSGESVSLAVSGKYIANFSDVTLIYYPIYYCTESEAGSIKEEDPIIIKPNSVERINVIPSYYFARPPATISSKYQGIDVRWVLESLSSVAAREGIEILED